MRGRSRFLKDQITAAISLLLLERSFESKQETTGIVAGLIEKGKMLFLFYSQHQINQARLKNIECVSKRRHK